MRPIWPRGTGRSRMHELWNNYKHLESLYCKGMQHNQISQYTSLELHVLQPWDLNESDLPEKKYAFQQMSRMSILSLYQAPCKLFSLWAQASSSVFMQCTITHSLHTMRMSLHRGEMVNP